MTMIFRVGNEWFTETDVVLVCKDEYRDDLLKLIFKDRTRCALFYPKVSLMEITM